MHRIARSTGGKEHDNRREAGHGEGHAGSESETGTETAKNRDNQAQTPRHVRGHRGLKAFIDI